MKEVSNRQRKHLLVIALGAIATISTLITERSVASVKTIKEADLFVKNGIVYEDHWYGDRKVCVIAADGACNDPASTKRLDHVDTYQHAATGEKQPVKVYIFKNRNAVVWSYESSKASDFSIRGDEVLDINKKTACQIDRSNGDCTGGNLVDHVDTISHKKTDEDGNKTTLFKVSVRLFKKSEKVVGHSTIQQKTGAINIPTK